MMVPNRMIFAALVACVFGCALPQQARADTLSRVGNFEVRTEKDRFGGSDKAVATLVAGVNILAVRCLNGELSLAVIEARLGQGRWEEGLAATIKVKVDDRPVVETVGGGINDKAIEIDDRDGLVASLVGAREVAIRIVAREITQDKIFTMKQSAKAVPIILKACHTEPMAPAGPDVTDSSVDATVPAATVPSAPMEARPLTPQAPIPRSAAPNVQDPISYAIAEPRIGPETSEPASPSADGSTRHMHPGLNAIDEAEISRVLPIYAASARCNRAVNSQVVGEALSKALPERQVFDASAVVQALSLMVEKQLADRQDARGISDEGVTALCAKAIAEYGAQGSVLRGAFQ